MQTLGYRKIKFVHVRNSGSIAHRNGATVFVKPKFHQKGAPDLIFAYRGIPVACEVKSRLGRVRPEQTEWINDWQGEPSRGYGFIARSVDDVLNHLRILDSKTSEKLDIIRV